MKKATQIFAVVAMTLGTATLFLANTAVGIDLMNDAMLACTDCMIDFSNAALACTDCMIDRIGTVTQIA